MTTIIQKNSFALNGICPYFTMFPLDFPLRVLSRRAIQGDVVLDPFCGRGTTNFAARLLGLHSVGVDSSPVAIAISASKLAKTSTDEILREAQNILATYDPCDVPDSEFWKWAYHPNVLAAICQFREAFLEDCSSDARLALRGIVLGALHGPKQKTFPSYFSNQCPRTYAPKPGYSIRYWRKRCLRPKLIDVVAVIERRAKRYYEVTPDSTGIVRLGDSRVAHALQPVKRADYFNWVITSPPYYGMKTYIPDQWLRNWFVGGPDSVDYSANGQISHSSPETFANDLRRVWKNAANVCAEDAKLVIRFGGIADRNVDSVEIIKSSLCDSRWKIVTIKNAGSATMGKRQANTFLRERSKTVMEYDIWARKSKL